MMLKPVKDIIGCAQLSGKADLVCQDKDSCDGDFNCVVGEVTRVYRKAGFRDLIITGRNIKLKAIKLVEKHNSLKKMKDLNWKNSDKLSQKENDFIQECEGLFDITKADTENLIRKDRMRSEEAKEEDIMFLRDQKTSRKMAISEAEDVSYEAAIKRKELRAERFSEMAKNVVKINEGDLNNTELEVSVDEVESDIDMDSNYEGKREEPNPNKSDKIIIELTADELIECTSEVSARYNIGVRPQTAIMSSILNKAGQNLDNVKISKSKVHQKRFQIIQEKGNEIRQDVIETLKGKRLVLHFDGKLVQEISEEKNISVKAERIAVGKA